MVKDFDAVRHPTAEMPYGDEDGFYLAAPLAVSWITACP
jgi:hypothetical protein